MSEEKNILDFIQPVQQDKPDAAYFEQLANQVINDSKKSKIVPLYQRPLMWIGAAAAIALIFVASNMYGQKEESIQLALSELSQAEITSYIENNIEDFDLTSIEDVVSADAMEDLEDDLAIENTTETVQEIEKVEEINLENIDSKEILEYFEEELIELEDIDESELFI